MLVLIKVDLCFRYISTLIFFRYVIIIVFGGIRRINIIAIIASGSFIDISRAKSVSSSKFSACVSFTSSLLTQKDYLQLNFCFHLGLSSIGFDCNDKMLLLFCEDLLRRKKWRQWCRKIISKTFIRCCWMWWYLHIWYSSWRIAVQRHLFIQWHWFMPLNRLNDRIFTLIIG